MRSSSPASGHALAPPTTSASSTAAALPTAARPASVTASNPSGEFLHVADSACNLATLNLLAFLRGNEFDVEAFTAAVELLVLAQDAIVDGSGYPGEQIERNATYCVRSGSVTPTSRRFSCRSGFPTTQMKGAIGPRRSPR
jgi:hypothetical protein